MSLWTIVLSVRVKECVVDVILPQSVGNKTEERERRRVVMINYCFINSNYRLTGPDPG